MLDTKKILAKNLSGLLDSRPDISRLSLSKQMQVADGTLGRIKYGNGNPTVEVLDQIARFFKKEAWQLLAPDMGEGLAGGSQRFQPLKQTEPSNDLAELIKNTNLPGFDRAKITRLAIVVTNLLVSERMGGGELDAMIQMIEARDPLQEPEIAPEKREEAMRLLDRAEAGENENTSSSKKRQGGSRSA